MLGTGKGKTNKNNNRLKKNSNKKTLKIRKDEIPKLIKKFKKGDKKNNGLAPNERYSSFDYCYNYFKSFKNKKDIASKENIEKSCLHLGFFLASWGMLRGSSFLLQKSIKYYEPLIKWIAKQDDSIWELDVDEYDEKNIKKLEKLYGRVNQKLKIGNHKRILVTKILLGVFGCVPALDSYFVKSLSGTRGNFTNALLQIKNFYDENKTEIDSCQKKIKTFSFIDGKKTKIMYPKAKIIDMIHFTRGYKMSEK